MEHTATFWQPENNKIRCLLCPHYCLLGENETGLCRTRQNKQHQLITMAYGNAAVIHSDPIEKKPLYHFLPGSSTLSVATKGCNLRCLNCQNSTLSQCGPETNEADFTTPRQIIEMAMKNDIPSLSFTYTEPTVFYEWMMDTAQLAKEHNIKTCMVSSGFINPEPLKKLLPYIDAVNIDLKAFDDDVYRKLCGASLKPVLKALELIKNEGVHLEITSLIIPGWNDNPATLQKMCDWLVAKNFSDIPIHFSRFFPAHKLLHLPATPEKTILAACHQARQSGLKYVYAGNMSESGRDSTICPDCKNTLITRHGYNVYVTGLRENRCAKCNTIIYGLFN
ncbi:AmmeMemoRadiSam system radical SAM enzyme [Geofilum sp. OHC36d9]|uniref:AmmeMemoRadiSam system radical SAM enzyme n=1 Tax=Geofilum sp. OHC36d9 TaxID=3458413 RepID=UPI0040335670